MIYTKSINEEELLESTNEFPINNERIRSQDKDATSLSKKAQTVKKHAFLCRADERLNIVPLISSAISK